MIRGVIVGRCSPIIPIWQVIVALPTHHQHPTTVAHIAVQLPRANITRDNDPIRSARGVRGFSKNVRTAGRNAGRRRAKRRCQIIPLKHASHQKIFVCHRFKVGPLCMVWRITKRRHRYHSKTCSSTRHKLCSVRSFVYSSEVYQRPTEDVHSIFVKVVRRLAQKESQTQKSILRRETTRSFCCTNFRDGGREVL